LTTHYIALIAAKIYYCQKSHSVHLKCPNKQMYNKISSCYCICL